MSALYINTNDTAKPRFDSTTSFFGIDYDVPGTLIARMLAAQHIVDLVAAGLQDLTTSRISNETAHKKMEAMWQEIAEIVHRFDGESAAMKRSGKATVVLTSAPSDDSSETQASSSSTKRKATQST